MNKKYYFSALALLTHYCSQPISIEPHQATNRNLGYDQCNMQTNGESHVIRHLIKSKMTVLDVGAHVGDWTREILRINNHVKIYAFEPIVQNYQELRKKFEANRTVSTFNLALSDNSSNDSMFFYDTPKASKLSSFFHRPILDSSLHAIPHEIMVTTITLDAFCKQHKMHHIDFLKIDTEGAEFRILKGAKDMLARQAISFIQFEYGGTYKDANVTLKKVYGYLTALEYHIFRISPAKLIYLQEWKPSFENYRYSNYLAVPTHKLKELM